MFKSALTKLTLVYVGLVMALCIIFSFVFFQFATHELNAGFKNQYRIISGNDHDSDNYNSVSGPELHARADHLETNLVYFNAAVLVGTVVAGYVLAMRTLRPIEAAHASQERFTAEASHELRTPLTAMKADTESILMTQDATTKQLRKALEENLHDIERLEKLSTHLLNMGRYKSKNNLATETIDLQTLIKETVVQAKRHYKNKHATIITDLQPAKALVEPIAIQQLLLIVIENALKYSRANAAVKVSQIVESNQIRITVEDTGIGISETDLPHIFEHFYRSSQAKSSDTASGYGLGLPLARDIVALYNGTIEVTSREGKGTIVTIFLPQMT
jgi:signal transduction histidine kinase